MQLSTPYWHGLILLCSTQAVMPLLLVNTIGKLCQQYKIYDVPQRQKQLLEELANMPIVSAAHGLGIYLALVLNIGNLTENATLWDHLLSFMVAFLWNEIQFFGSHYAYHRVKWLWWIHKTHHRAVVLSGYTSWLFSFAEKFIFAVLLTT